MLAVKQVSLFRNGRNQAVRIPREFELEGNKAIIHKEGDRLIIEPCPKKELLTVLSEMESSIESLPNVDDGLEPLDDIIL